MKEPIHEGFGENTINEGSLGRAAELDPAIKAGKKQLKEIKPESVSAPAALGEMFIQYMAKGEDGELDEEFAEQLRQIDSDQVKEFFTAINSNGGTSDNMKTLSDGARGMLRRTTMTLKAVEDGADKKPRIKAILKEMGRIVAEE